MRTRTPRPGAADAGLAPLAPRRKWRAIMLATLVLAPAYWSLLVGVVSVASDRRNAPGAGPFIAFGLVLVPFVFVALAFLSEHPRAPGATVRAMLLSLAVGIPVSALSSDAVSGFVAGIGAGGIAALRSDLDRAWRARALAILIVTAWAFVTVRVVPEAALFLAPVLPFTSLGVADHLLEIRRERRAAEGGRPGLPE
ncbi:MAG TPA: hypothetical protein VFK59_11525 [Actinomycetota bacterium]|jgi:hypothetical protein|nr:hypothetical protein [Actinomycetota bacterium]